MGKHLAYKGGGCIFMYFTLFAYQKKSTHVCLFTVKFTAKLATLPNEATCYRSTLNSEQYHECGIASEHG